MSWSRRVSLLCCGTDLIQMIREKKLERRRQRRKAVEHQQQDQEAELMNVSPANARDEQQEQVKSTSTLAKQHTPAVEADRVRRRRRRRRPKPSADDRNVEKYENGWPATRSESEHLPGGLNNANLVASQSEPNTLNPDVSSGTPRPLVYNGISAPLASNDLFVQPAFLQKLTNDFDVEPRSYYPPHQSNV